MITDYFIQNLSADKSYSRDDLFCLFSCEKPDLSESTFRWILYHLLLEQKLFRTGYDTYAVHHLQYLPDYHPVYSDTAMNLMKGIADKYPELDFVIFESTLLNEFLNHQIANNTIYVQVDREISSFIFDYIKEEYPGGVLYQPSKKEFDKYWVRNCVVVLNLISQAPSSFDHPHEMPVEKMLVDIVAEKSIAATFSPSELPSVFENVSENYRIDKRTLNRYAGRRGKTEQVMKLLQESGV